MIKFYNDFWQKNKEGHFFDFSFKWPLVKELVTKKKKLTILDYGCGTGIFIGELLMVNPNLEIFGIDISDYAINVARKKFKNAQFFVQTEEKKLPFANNSVDLILAMDVIEHVFDVKTLLHEFHRILSPGGKIFISTPYHGFIKNLFIIFLGFDVAFDPTAAHIRFFSKKSLLSLLNQEEFMVLKFGFYGRFYPLSRAMYVVAKK